MLEYIKLISKKEYNPTEKTDTMTIPVGKDESGQLFAEGNIVVHTDVLPEDSANGADFVFLINDGLYINDRYSADGLAYTLKDDGTYEVSGIGTCKNTDIFIPSVYKGVPVTSIGYQAFQYCNSLTSVTIPNSIVYIGYQAFYQCYRLTSAVFSNTTGWEISQSSDFVQGEGTVVALDDVAQNATYLRTTYRNYYWRRF